MGYTIGVDWKKDGNEEKLKRLVAMGLTAREIAPQLGTTTDAIWKKIARMKVGKKQAKAYGIILDDVFEEPSVEELLDYVILGQELIRKFDPRQREIFPEFKTNKWIGIVIQGDWHFEHYKTDLRSLVDDLETIGKAKDVFYIFNGDVGDWADIRFKGYNLPSSVLPIRLRYKIIFHLISKIPNLLSVTAGCHDDWLKNRGFFDIIDEIKNKRNDLGLKTYYLGYGGYINFTVGKATYRIAVFHKGGRENINSIYHPCVKHLKENDATPDVVAYSHRHDKVGVSYEYFQHKPRIFVRSGSHQYLTDYAWKEGFIGAVNKAPMVLLNGAKKEMRACVNYKEGLEDLRRLNSE